MLQLQLIRTYYPDEGTNGKIYLNGTLVCFTIELPWLDNQHCVSCIPERTYTLVKRSNKHHHNHLLVQRVPGRDLILLHPANDAEEELQGCIAPVSFLTGHGCGGNSRIALDKLLAAIEPAFNNKEKVFLTISSKK
jgi:hypothetical protein